MALYFSRMVEIKSSTEAFYPSDEAVLDAGNPALKQESNSLLGAFISQGPPQSGGTGQPTALSGFPIPMATCGDIANVTAESTTIDHESVGLTIRSYGKVLYNGQSIVLAGATNWHSYGTPEPNYDPIVILDPAGTVVFGQVTVEAGSFTRYKNFLND